MAGSSFHVISNRRLRRWQRGVERAAGQRSDEGPSRHGSMDERCPEGEPSVPLRMNLVARSALTERERVGGGQAAGDGLIGTDASLGWCRCAHRGFGAETVDKWTRTREGGRAEKGKKEKRERGCATV
ncbi:hypothetical protein CSOJ01_14626 [Colletotrichum sojae]|uniref:Uncharacterized protein n=1 Tax=Colletotrichum sojae TaxID=2175907 RepID=A0A8H6MJP8_9PEZI|nr:hypothetical protein CSOJ01_14626 [Colletotrichum sojae]